MAHTRKGSSGTDARGLKRSGSTTGGAAEDSSGKSTATAGATGDLYGLGGRERTTDGQLPTRQKMNSRLIDTVKYGDNGVL